ncbi:hypothetical protein [Dethiosulfatarculus sandiegensis]|uniref:Solute-binding protein family 3/N-terminal domain-containing protein n=1 Tax=Dethiosulfatarculus sandiegensis TaxID=1429043 RepID=A0A0D2JV52_9BACT|nr:hypothetical protein [Dethiosulfatarculus sandiegensis]KIX13435.1 hypothetical protein X474_14485 [Dethiosulfatarculus sandiegensis]
MGVKKQITPLICWGKLELFSSLAKRGIGRFILYMTLVIIAILAGWPDASLARIDKVVKVSVYDNPPLIKFGENVPIQGIFPDLLEDIAISRSWRLHFVKGSWSQSLELVLVGCGAFDLTSRELMQRTLKKRMTQDLQKKLNAFASTKARWIYWLPSPIPSPGPRPWLLAKRRS